MTEPLSYPVEFTVDDLIKYEFKSPPTLIRGLLNERGKLLIHGAEGTCKTHTALTLAKCVAEGGIFVRDYVCAQGSVVFLQLDMSLALQQKRVIAAADVLQGLPIHFFIDDLELLDPFKELKRPGTLISAAQKIRPKLLILDCLDKGHQGDENDNSHATAVWTAWANLFPESAICFIHHDRKPAINRDGAEVSSKTASRGARAWRSRADTIIQLTRSRDGAKPERTRVRMAFHKTRDMKEPPPIYLWVDDTDEGTGTLLMVPDTETPTDLAIQWALTHKGAVAKSHIVRFLTTHIGHDGKPIVSKSRAYEIADVVVELYGDK